MRASTFLLVACLALLASSALAFRVPARLREVQDAKQLEDPALSPVCLAKCAAETAWCVHQCSKSVSSDQFGLTCKQQCAVSAASCSGKCGKKSEQLEAPEPEAEQQWPSTEGLDELTQDVMDMSESLAEAAPVGVSPVCLAGCAATTASCIMGCLKSNAAWCKTQCTAQGALCAAGCALKTEEPANLAPLQLTVSEAESESVQLNGVDIVCVAQCASDAAVCLKNAKNALQKAACAAKAAVCTSGCKKGVLAALAEEVEPVAALGDSGIDEQCMDECTRIADICVKKAGWNMAERGKCMTAATICTFGCLRWKSEAPELMQIAEQEEADVQAELDSVLQVDEPDFELGANVECLAKCAIKAAECKKKAKNFLKKAACVAKAAICVAGCKKSVLAEPEFEEVLLLEQVAEEQPAALEANVVCLAECAAKALACKKKAKNFIKKAACAAKAAICVAKCSVKSEFPPALESQVDEQTKAAVEAAQAIVEAAPVGADAVCLARCAADTAVCIFACTKTNTPWCKTQCAATGVVCATTCAQGVAVEQEQEKETRLSLGDSSTEDQCVDECVRSAEVCVENAGWDVDERAKCVEEVTMCTVGCMSARSEAAAAAVSVSSEAAPALSLCEDDDPDLDSKCMAECERKAEICVKNSGWASPERLKCAAEATICAFGCFKKKKSEEPVQAVAALGDSGIDEKCMDECTRIADICVKKAGWDMAERGKCVAAATLCTIQCLKWHSEAPVAEVEVPSLADSDPDLDDKCMAECTRKAEICVKNSGWASAERLKCAAEVTICTFGCFKKKGVEAPAPVVDTQAQLESVLELEEPEMELGANVECLAQCAVKAAACKKKAKNFLKKAACVAKAAICVASCKKSVLAEPEFEEALQLQETPVALQANVVCLAECAAKALSCKKKAKNFIKKAACAAKAAICVAKCSVKSETPEYLQSVVSAESVIDSSNIADFFSKAATDVQFQSFKAEHGKKYDSPALEAYRFTLFQENMRQAAELQRLNPEAEFGANQFSDLHPLEFKRMYLNYQPAVGDAAINRLNVPLTETPRKAAPESFDWRRPDSGRPVAVTPVKDQGRCGSCWAFSAVETVESAFILAGNPATELSTEQVVDCDRVDHGCNGGDTVTAYKYMQGTGLQTEQDYPYTAGKTGRAETCQYKSDKIATKVSGFTYATPACFDSCTKQDEELLKENLYNAGPVSICVSASVWQSYRSGILTSASGCKSGYYQLDHCVQLVGYGTDPSGAKFWSARNSWATSWGEAGYIRLAYGANTCGLADEATHVQL